jgi:hypothetical protein
MAVFAALSAFISSGLIDSPKRTKGLARIGVFVAGVTATKWD